MINKTYTDDELMARVWETEEIKKLAHKRVYYISNNWREKELDELWTKEHADTASFGSNTGYYIGLDHIRKWYASVDRSVGWLISKPLSTCVLELAGDGKTARAVWYCIGQESSPERAMWVTGKVAIDFIKEADGWKIWHLIEENDLTCDAGHDFSEDEPYWYPETSPVSIAFGEPDKKVLTHDPNFNWWDDFPAVPEPYETFDPAHSYGPEGFVKPWNKGYNAGEGGNWR